MNWRPSRTLEWKVPRKNSLPTDLIWTRNPALLSSVCFWKKTNCICTGNVQALGELLSKLWKTSFPKDARFLRTRDRCIGAIIAVVTKIRLKSPVDDIKEPKRPPGFVHYLRNGLFQNLLYNGSPDFREKGDIFPLFWPRGLSTKSSLDDSFCVMVAEKELHLCSRGWNDLVSDLYVHDDTEGKNHPPFLPHLEKFCT